MGRGIAVRIALAALASAAVGLAILAVGVTVVGADIFTALMVEADAALYDRKRARKRAIGERVAAGAA